VFFESKADYHSFFRSIYLHIVLSVEKNKLKCQTDQDPVRVRAPAPGPQDAMVEAILPRIPTPAAVETAEAVEVKSNSMSEIWTTVSVF